MLVFKIEGLEVKDFMNKLFKENIFDDFEVRNVEIFTFTKFQISGILDKDFLSETTSRNFCTWEELKNICFNLVKGTKKPKLIKIVFSLSEDETLKLHENASALFLNINFKNNEMICSSADSQKIFIMDKTVSFAWEDYLKNFLKENNIIALD